MWYMAESKTNKERFFTMLALAAETPSPTASRRSAVHRPCGSTSKRTHARRKQGASD